MLLLSCLLGNDQDVKWGKHGHKGEHEGVDTWWSHRSAGTGMTLLWMWTVRSWDVLALWDVLEREKCQGLSRSANRPGKSNSSIYWVQQGAGVVRWERQPASLGHAGGWVLSLPETFQWNINAVNFQFIQNIYKPVPVLVVLSSVMVLHLRQRFFSKVRNHSSSSEISSSLWMIFPSRTIRSSS